MVRELELWVGRDLLTLKAHCCERPKRLSHWEGAGVRDSAHTGCLTHSASGICPRIHALCLQVLFPILIDQMLMKAQFPSLKLSKDGLGMLCALGKVTKF